VILAEATQEVYVDSVYIYVQGCSVKRSRDQRVGEASFVVDKDVNDAQNPLAYDAVVMDAEVEIIHTADGVTLTDRGTIYSVKKQSASGAHWKEVTVRSQEERLQRIRVRGEWQDMDAADLVAELITNYGVAAGVSQGTLDSDGRKIAEVVGKYDTWYDLMEQISEQTGLSWDVDNLQVNLYVPEEIYGPTISQGAFGDGTASVELDLDGVFNYVRMQAYEYEYIEVLAEACSVSARLPIAGPGWELSGDIVFPQSWTKEMLQDLKFELDLENMFARWEQPEYPFFAKFYVRRQAWVTRKDDASIALYGRREAAPLSADGGISVANANLILAAYLEKHAFPIAAIKGIQPTNFGHKPDAFAVASLPDQGIEQDVYISSVERAMDQGDLFVTLDITTRAGVGKNHDVAVEMMRRIEKLERSGLSPAVYQGQPVSHPEISPPEGQTAVKDGDVITVAGSGSPERTLSGSTCRDLNNNEVLGSDTTDVEYDPETGLFGGTFIMGTNPTEFVRLEAILENTAGASFADNSRSNPLDVINEPPTGASIIINGGDPTTSNPVLNLALSATSPYDIEMYIDGDIADAGNVRTWVPFQASTTVTVASGITGTVEVSVIFREARAHNEASLVSDDIYYDP